MSKKGLKNKLRRQRKKQARWHAVQEKVLLTGIALNTRNGSDFVRGWLTNAPQNRYFCRERLQRIHTNNLTWA